MQGVLVFASSAARSAAITSPQEGQYSYLKDTNSTEYYDGAAWIAAPIGDITGVTAGTGISGGGTSGTVTITNSMATVIAGTGSATFDNLAVGTNGQTLVADSTAATGLKWATPSSGTPAFVGVGLYNQAVSFSYTAGVNKQITFTTENFDTNTFHDNSTNTSRITIPVGYAGKYNIQATWASDSAGGYGNIYLYKNGSAITNIGTDGGKIVGVGGMSNNYFALNGGVTISLAEADYLEIYIQFSNTVTTNTYAKFSATFLGA
jgi:hypothetical protein